MKRLLLTLFALSTCFAQISKVQTVSASDLSGFNIGYLDSPGMTVSAGNLLDVSISWYKSSGTMPTVTCTDTAGSNFVFITATSFDAHNRVAKFYVKNTTAQSGNVVRCSMNNGGGAYVTLIVTQYSGADTTSPLDVSVVSDSGSSTSSSFTSSGITTNYTDEAVSTFVHNSGGFTVSYSATGFTQTGSGNSTAAFEKIVSTIQTSLTFAATANVTGNWELVMVGYKAAGSGGSTPVSIYADDTSILYTGRWYPTGSATTAKATTINAGSHLAFVAKAASTISLNFDLTGVSYAPDIMYRVDHGTPTRSTVSSTVALTLPSGNNHNVEVWVEGISEGSNPSFNQWSSLAGALKFTGLILSTGATLSPIASSPNIIEFIGDSITAGVRQLSACAGVSTATCMGTSNGWAAQTAELLSMRAVVTGFGGQGITVTGSGSVPVASSTLDYVYSGASYSPAQAPIAVVVAQGTNDSGASGATFITTYEALLSAIRTKYPSTFIFALGQQSNAHASDVATSVSALADSRMFYLNYTALGLDTTDGTHLSTDGAITLAAKLASDIQTQFNTSSIKMQ